MNRDPTVHKCGTVQVTSFVKIFGFRENRRKESHTFCTGRAYSLPRHLHILYPIAFNSAQRTCSYSCSALALCKELLQAGCILLRLSMEIYWRVRGTAASKERLGKGRTRHGLHHM